MDGAADVADDRGLDALGRFVEHQQFRPRHQGAADGQLLLLAAGKIAAAPAHHFGEHREQAENLVVDHPLVARQRGIAGHQVLAHGQQREDFAPLRHVANAAARAHVGRQPADLLVHPGDRARCDRLLADDGAQQRRLADAVAAEHAGDAADRGLQRDVRSACAAP